MFRVQLQRVIFITGIFLTLIFQVAKGQSKSQKFVEVSYDQGPIIGNHKDWADELIDMINYSGVDVRFAWRSKDNNYFNYLDRYPIYGVGFTSTLNYYPEIGRPMAFYAFGEVPFNKYSTHRKWDLSYFGQFGIGFNVNPYDPETNPLNQFLGSSVNSHIHLGFKANYKLSQRFTAFSSIGLRHYSNGSIKKPNSGVNFAPVSLGLRISLDKEEFDPGVKPVFPPLEKGWVWNIAMYNGLKSYEIGEKVYYRGGIGVNYLWDFSYKYKMGIGLDWFYGAGTKKRYPEEKLDFFDKNSFAIVGSWEWNLSEHLYIPIGIGVYLSRADYNQEVSKIYERVGVRYRFNSNVFAGVQIKAHKAKADFFEFTVGYTISHHQSR